jgi:hypothetical protein
VYNGHAAPDLKARSVRRSPRRSLPSHSRSYCEAQTSDQADLLP